MNSRKLVLASTSPRRSSLLMQLGVEFDVVDPGNAENSIELDPENHVMEHALCKAKAVAENYPDRLVIAADTIVVFMGRILEKPRNREEAKEMLRALGNKTHMVISAVAIVEKGKGITDVRTEKTKVTMMGLNEDEIETYVATGEPMDKAGAYAAQGVGAVIIERVDGCFYNVVGLPLNLLHRMLKEVGYNTLLV